MDEVAENLFVGDFEDADRLGTNHSFDAVVSLIEDNVEAETIYEPLTDGENNQKSFDSAVDAVQEVWSDDKRVLVHCAMGVSRSVTVTATAIAAEREISLRDALAQVEENRPQANPHPELVEQAYTYLGRQPPQPFDSPQDLDS